MADELTATASAGETVPVSVDLELTHTAAGGTVLTGDPRSHHDIVAAAGYRYSRRIPGWYKPRTRDRLLDNIDKKQIQLLAADLQAAGFTVAIDLDTMPRSAAERAADRAERAADRSAHLTAKAERLHAASDTFDAKARSIADTISLGQPIIVGHHSERHARRDHQRIQDGMRKSVELYTEARGAERQSRAAAGGQAHRESVPAMLRRVERLEVEQRKIVRELTPCKTSGRKLRAGAEVPNTLTCPACYLSVSFMSVDGTPAVEQHGMVTGDHADRPATRSAVITDEVDYLRNLIADAEAAGVKLWGPADFVKGDLVHLGRGRRSKVVRVNAKSLSVETDYSWTDKVAYDQVTGRTPAEL